MIYSQPVTEIIRKRFSARTYQNEPIPVEKQEAVQASAQGLQEGPLGTHLHFRLEGAGEQERRSLKSLAVYGVVKNPGGFLIGAMKPGPKDLEDFGYRMEQLILKATDLGLGTCWIGGPFTRSDFARKLAAGRDEHLPAVATIGTMDGEMQGDTDPIRVRVGATTRLPWERLFFEERFGAPLSCEKAGAYAEPLEMLRLGPSASNKQPWRVIRQDGAWHFYLQRTPGYPGVLPMRLLGVADLQRLDMGIAMSHFELTAREAGLQGTWVVEEPGIQIPGEGTEYCVTWKS